MEHVGKFPCALGDVTFDCVGQRVHTCRCGKPFGHGAHHVGVDNCHYGDIVHVYAHHFAVFVRIGDDVVDSNFRSRACRGRDGNDGNTLVFGGCNALKRNNV